MEKLNKKVEKLKLNKKAELRKETLNLKKENLVLRAKLMKIGDTIKAYEETGENSVKTLREIANVIRYE